MFWRSVVLAITVGGAACYSPDLSRCHVTCQDSDHCPGAQLCLDDSFCHEPSDTLLCDPDADPGMLDATDAMPDAGPDAEIPRDLLAISVGGDHACAIDGDTHLWCWGSNRHGQVGVASTAFRVLTPVDHGAGWDSVDAGNNHTCGIKSGALYCWGSDTYGQVSDGNAPYHVDTPTELLAAGGGWLQVSAGEAFTCGVRDDAPGHHVYCWGSDYTDQLGDGDGVNSSGPSIDALAPTATAQTFDDWASVSAGVYTACAVRTTGEAYCWGLGDLGRLGDGTVVGKDEPTRVLADLDDTVGTFRSISVGNTAACAIGTNGRLYCWGDNGYGQLGIAGLSSPLQPQARRVSTDTDWLQVDVSYMGSCGTRADGAFCWGGSQKGANGDLEWADRATPTQVVGAGAATRISQGWESTCAIAGPTAWCWGDNPEGELGNGETSAKHVPAAVSPTDGLWTAVAAGSDQTCAVHDGDVMCWGWNAAGAVTGLPVSEGSAIPVAVGVGAGTASAVSVSSYSSCALVDGGSGARPWCWGYNSDGQVGTNASPGGTFVPTSIAAAGVWTDLVGTGRAVCGIDATGRLCWGLGSGYGLGNNSIAQVLQPTAADADAYLEVGLGYQFGCGIQTDKDLACWGLDVWRQQGDGATDTLAMTPHVLSGHLYVDLGVAWESDHVCAIADDLDLYCWGRNDRGQLGFDSGAASVSVPTKINVPGDWLDVAAGNLTTCGIKDDTESGELHCWGTQAFNQLGIDEVVTLADTPQRVGTDIGWTQVTVGAEHACALRDGNVYCWGNNLHGQIGDGTRGHPEPVMVVFP